VSRPTNCVWSLTDMAAVNAIASALGWIVMTGIFVAGAVCVVASGVDAFRRGRDDFRRFARAYDDAQRFERARTVISHPSNGAVRPSVVPTQPGVLIDLTSRKSSPPRSAS